MAKLNLKGAVKGAQKALPFIAGGIGGAVAGGFIAPKIPMGNDKIKQGILTAGGLLMFGMAKNKGGLMAGFGAGLAIGSGIQLVKLVAPTLGIQGMAQIAGDETKYVMIDAEPSGKPVNGSSQISGAQIAGNQSNYGANVSVY